MFNRRYENQLMEYFSSMQAINKLAVLNLGGVSGALGGSGGPPGGIIGQLAQVNVTYDTTEGESLYTPASGMSLLDNLNHIRYRINTLEDAPGEIEVSEDGASVISDATVLNFVGDGISVTSSGTTANITLSLLELLALSSLSDVTLASVISGESIVYNGAMWVNAPVQSSSGISSISVEEDGVPISSAITTLNFTGDIEVTESDGTATINITTSGASGYIVLEEIYTNDDLSSLCDGEETEFLTTNTFKSGTTLVYLNGLLQRPGSGNSYLEKETLNGIDFYIPPEVDDELLITYSTEEYPTITEIKIGSETDFTFFDAYGHQIMSGNARPWRDELGELLLKAKNGTRISNNLSDGTVVFSDTCVIATDWVIMNVQLNHDKDLQSELHPHIHYIQTESGVPNWLLQHRWQTNGIATTSGWTSGAWTDLAFEYDESNRFNQIVAFPAVTPPANVSISDIVQFKIFRDTNNDSTLFDGNDPITGNVEAYMYDVHFQINSLGSDEEYTK